MFKVMMVLIIITIGWGGGRDKKEKPSTWSRLQTTSPACFIMIMLVMFMLMMVLMVLIIITIWGLGDKKEMPATWSRLQTASPACRCRRRESRRNFNAGSDVWRLFLQRGCNRNIVEKGHKFLWIKIMLWGYQIYKTLGWKEEKFEKIFKIFSGRLKQRTWVGETETVAGSGQIRVGRQWDRALHCTPSNWNQKYKYKNQTDTNTNKHKHTENTGEKTNWCHKSFVVSPALFLFFSFFSPWFEKLPNFGIWTNLLLLGIVWENVNPKWQILFCLY